MRLGLGEYVAQINFGRLIHNHEVVIVPDGAGFEDLVRRLVEGTHVVAHIHHGIQMGQVSLDLRALVLDKSVALCKHGNLQSSCYIPQKVELQCFEFTQVLQAIHDLRDVFVVVFFLLLVGDIYGDEVGVFGVVHIKELLLVGALCFGLVAMRFGLLALAFEILACVVIFALDFAQIGVAGIAASFELIGIFGMALTQLIESGVVEL